MVTQCTMVYITRGETTLSAFPLPLIYLCLRDIGDPDKMDFDNVSTGKASRRP